MSMIKPRRPTRPALPLFALAVFALLGLPEGASAQSPWTTNGNNISNTNTGNVGVGTNSPTRKLEVRAPDGDAARLYRDGNFVGWGVNVVFALNNSNNVKADYAGVFGIISNAAAGAEGGSLVFGTATSGSVTEKMRINSAGNVGIGTAAPAHKLDVAGNVNASGLCLGGTCKTSWSEISGSGSQWATSGSSIYYDGGNVGIGPGMTAPNEALVVNGKVSINRWHSPGPAEFRIYNGGSIAEWSFRQSGAASHNLNISKSVSGVYTDYMTVDTAGNVGVGTTAPAQKLHVLGGNVFHQFSSVAGQELGFYTSVSNNHLASNVYFDGQWKMMTAGKAAFISTSPFEGNAFSVYADNTPRAAGAVPSFAQYMVVSMAGNVGVGTNSPGARLDVGAGAAARGPHTDLLLGAGGNDAQLEFYGATKSTAITHDETAGGLVFYTNGPAFAPSLFLGNGGNVGVGTMGPTHKLDVAGNVNASGLCLGGDCKTSWSQVVGTPNQWTTSGTSVHYNAGNVGVGTSAPAYKLHVEGASAFSNNFIQGYFKNTNPAFPFGGIGVDGQSQSHVRFMLGGALKWQWRVGAGEGLDDLRAFNWALNADVLTMTNTGNVGVGTVTPAARLHVAGDIKVDGNINAKYQDVAEWVPSKQKLSAGTVVVLDPERPNHVRASTSSYDTAVAGVISEKPGLSLGEAGEGKALVATTGRVKVRVDATRSPIRIGDLIVTSDVEGAAMKSQPILIGGRRIHSPGTIIGKALEPLEKGVGEILVLLSLQ